MLEEEGIITHRNHQWQWDLKQLKLSIVLDSVVALLVAKVDCLKNTSFLQYMLQIAAFLGTKFDQNLVEIILPQDGHNNNKDGAATVDVLEKVAQCFKRAVKEELIAECPPDIHHRHNGATKNCYYKFTHKMIVN